MRLVHNDPHFEQDFTMSKKIAEKLLQHYPGHAWGVHASKRTGVVEIQLMSGDLAYGYRLRLIDVNSDPSLAKVKIAGGEILERANLTRGAFDEDQFNNAPKTAEGDLVMDRG